MIDPLSKFRLLETMTAKNVKKSLKDNVVWLRYPPYGADKPYYSSFIYNDYQRDNVSNPFLEDLEENVEATFNANVLTTRGFLYHEKNDCLKTRFLEKSHKIILFLGAPRRVTITTPTGQELRFRPRSGEAIYLPDNPGFSLQIAKYKNETSHVEFTITEPFKPRTRTLSFPVIGNEAFTIVTQDNIDDMSIGVSFTAVGIDTTNPRTIMPLTFSVRSF